MENREQFIEDMEGIGFIPSGDKPWGKYLEAVEFIYSIGIRIMNEGENGELIQCSAGVYYSDGGESRWFPDYGAPEAAQILLEEGGNYPEIESWDLRNDPLVRLAYHGQFPPVKH